MKPAITGIVIDQTREAGKWYVREVKDETGGGVKPVFFRREKNDLIGRLYDKLRGAESAQRYAAAHLDELDESSRDDPRNIMNDQGFLTLAKSRTKKLDAETLQKLLDRKCELVGPGKPSEGPQKIDDGVSLVTVITAKDKALKREVDRLWSSFQGADNISKDDFKRLMQLSLQIAEDHVKSNDIKILNECKNFIGKLSSEGTGAWKNQQVPEKFQFLKIFFQGDKTSEAPASTTAAETSAVADPLSGFMPKGTDLGPDQIFEKNIGIQITCQPTNPMKFLGTRATKWLACMKRGFVTHSEFMMHFLRPCHSAKVSQPYVRTGFAMISRSAILPTS